MRILLTGASGTVGRWLTNILSGVESIELTTLSRSPLNESRRHVCHDLAESVPPIGPFDCVIHAAAVVDESSEAKVDLIQKNIQMAYHAASIAKNNQTKQFVHLSSMSVYGARGTALLDESAPARPDSFYSVSKLVSEHVIDLSLGSTVDVCHLRLGYVLSEPLPDRYFMVRIFRKLMNSEPIELVNAHTTRFCFIHVTDIANVIQRAVERRLKGLFNLAAPEAPTLYEVFSFLESISKQSSSIRYVEKPDLIMANRIDSSKLEQSLLYHQWYRWQDSLASLQTAKRAL